MGRFPQSVSRACPGLWTQAKASEPLGRGGGYQRMPLSPRPAHLSLPPSLPWFPLAPLVLFAHWPLCSSQGFPPEVGGLSPSIPWGTGWLRPTPRQRLLPEPARTGEAPVRRRRLASRSRELADAAARGGGRSRGPRGRERG